MWGLLVVDHEDLDLISWRENKTRRWWWENGEGGKKR